MIFVSVDEFLRESKSIQLLSKSEEKELAQKMSKGDQNARLQLIRAYLPYVAAVIRRSPKDIQTLNTLYSCISALEKGVDSFNFLQEGESFGHRLSIILRRCTLRAIAGS